MALATILFAGSGAFGAPSLERLLQAGYPIVRVVTQPDRPAGRGRKTTPTPIGQLAENLGLDVTKTDAINTERLPAADVMVVIAFGQKISPQRAAEPKLGSINLHASRLPKYRGAAPVNWAILQGERRTGNSIIRLAERMDAGAVLGQSELVIGELETAGELHDRLAEDGATLLLHVLEQLTRGQAIQTPQDESLATLAPKLNRSATLLDWSRPATELAARIRGLSPWPGCRIRVINELDNQTFQLGLLRAAAAECSGGGEVGRINAAGQIIAGGGAVELLEVQPEGKRGMTMAQFLNGHAWPIGARVQSIL